MRIILILAAVLASRSGAHAASLKRTDFGKLPDGAVAHIFTLTNAKGVEARITNYGGIVVSLKVPDRNGVMADVVLGHDTLAGYLPQNKGYLGATVGRYANRIGKGTFTIEGKVYSLARNNGENALHGGLRGFDKALWIARELPDGRLELSYSSKDGEEGYPGTLSARLTFTLTDQDELRIEYLATTDKPTVVNLTNHSYFNLRGAGNSDILGHLVTLNADRFTPVDAGLIPTGELRPVAGTPFDFLKPTAIGARIEQNDEQLKLGKGYDHNFVLNRRGAGLSLAARVEDPSTGRVMEVLTTEPGVQFYTGNVLDGSVVGKGGVPYRKRMGFCLETQHFPDSPNKPAFPSALLKPGARYESATIYRFSAAKRP